MPTLEAIESIQAALEPLEALQEEHTQLESWVHDSFGALEKLHGDLSEWQSELARKQTDLDLREDALEKCQGQNENLDQLAGQWKIDLETAREEARQLEDENGEQLQELEELERRHLLLESELQAARQRTEELTAALELERARTTEEQQRWTQEFQQLRGMLEEQHHLLADHLSQEKLSQEKKNGVASSEPLETTTEPDPALRSSELRRRAQSRRAAKRRQQSNPEEANDS
ncbi:MAG: hypothetical protein GXP28_06210 [Planctomycetes bacterium]|nr:hypothetical protein [Planctomycetota bacterium]